MPMTGAERQKKYIAKLKAQNPEKYEEKRKKHLEKVKVNQRKISDLIESEKVAQRQKWKEANNRRKEKKRQVEIQNTEGDTKNNKEDDMRRGREMNAAKRALQLKTENIKLKKTNKKLLEKMSNMMKRIVVIKKRLYRSKKYIQHLQARNHGKEKDNQPDEKDFHETNHTEKMTPMSKANNFVEAEVPFLQKEKKERVKRKIFELNVLSESLKQEYSNAKTNDEKKVLKHVAHNDFVKKYNLTGKFTSKLGLKGRIRKMQPKETKENVNIQKIKAFYIRDDVSRATAGRKECKTQNKNKQQKRFLLDNMLNLYSKYKSEGGKGSYTTFTRCRPFFVVNPTISDRNTCACIKHSNLSLKVQKLKDLKIIGTSKLTELVTQISCNIESKQCMYNTCKSCKSEFVALTQQSITGANDNITWLKWGLKNHDYVKIVKNGERKVMTTKKVVKDVKTGTVSELIIEFNKELRTFKTHFFNIGHQHKALQNCIKNLSHDEVLIICDFSENYSCKLHQEIQSVHFGGNRNQISLHTGVIYSKNNKPGSFCSISPSCDHDPGAIWAHLSPVLEYAKQICPPLKVVHMFSDGPSTQYKQKKNFYLLSKIIKETTFDYASWSFFESSHGKGAADGVGAAVKRTLDGFVSHGKDVPDANTAFEVLKETEKLVKYFYIPAEKIREMQQKIPDDLTALPGTMRVHQIVTTNKEGSVLYRDLSCFCGTKKGYCKCYEPRTHDLISTNKPSRKRNRKRAAKNLRNKRKRSMSSDSENINSDTISYAESDDSTYCEEEDMLAEFLDIQEFEIKADYIVDMEEIQASGLVNREAEKPGKEETLKDTQLRKNDVGELEIETIDLETAVGIGRASNVNDAQLAANKLGNLKTETSVVDTIDVEDVQLAESNAGDLKIEMLGEAKMEIDDYQRKMIDTEYTNKKKENLPSYDRNCISTSIALNKTNTPSLSILSEINVEMILNEKTGFIEIIKKKDTAKLEIGKYVLANFFSNSKKVYKYVCVIEDTSDEKVVVKGLKSKNKNRTTFERIENDISIIEKNDIVACLPDPKEIGGDCIFETSINVKEM